jgi:hypothetical protein
VKLSQPIGGADAAPRAGELYSVQRLRRAVTRFLGGQVLQALGYAAVLLLLVRLLPVRDYGAYMLLSGLAEMTLIVASFGLLSTGRRYLPQVIVSSSRRHLFGFVFAIVGLQLGILATLTVLLWRHWDAASQAMALSAEQAAAAKTGLALFLLVPAVRFACELLDSLLEQGRSRLVSACMINARLAGIALLAGAGGGIDLRSVLAIDVTVTAACLMLAYGFLIRSLSSLRPAAADGPLPLRDIARFMWHMAPSDLLGSASSAGALRLALANSIGVAESGLFAFLQSLQRLAGRYLLPGTLLRSLIMPMLVARASAPAGASVLAHGASLLIKSNVIVVGAGIAVIAVGGDRIVGLLSGGKFPQAGFTLLLMFVALVSSAQGVVLGMVMQVTARASVLRTTSLLAPLALLLIWLFADRGLDFAVMILIASGVLSNLIVVAALRRSAGIGIEWRGQGAVYLAMLGAIAAGRAVEAAGLSAVPSGGVALACFGLLLVLTRPFNAAEYAMVEKTVGRRMALRTIGLLAKRS